MSVTVTTRHVVAPFKDHPDAIDLGTPHVAVEELHTAVYQDATTYATDPQGGLHVLELTAGLVTTDNPEGIPTEKSIAIYGPGQWMRAEVGA